jgi:hypothetical protein
MRRTLPCIVLVLLIGALPSRADDQAKARFQWIMNCQGCHLADASGSAKGAPNMAGSVSRFLAVEGGREYLGRVPGVAFAPLSDADLAVLLNWSLATFDPQHVPADFRPYTPEEVGRLRGAPLVSDAAEHRYRLLRKLGTP